MYLPVAMIFSQWFGKNIFRGWDQLSNPDDNRPHRVRRRHIRKIYVWDGILCSIWRRWSTVQRLGSVHLFPTQAVPKRKKRSQSLHKPHLGVPPNHPKPDRFSRVSTLNRPHERCAHVDVRWNYEGKYHMLPKNYPMVNKHRPWKSPISNGN